MQPWTTFPKLGQGTWRIGDDPARRKDEIAALRRGIELGMTLIDTAEMYGSGRAEQLLGEALCGLPRDAFQLVSKVLPHNAGRDRLFESFEASLRRLGVEHLDLYLLHWRGGVPLAETVACMEELVCAGKLLRWGVSNFDTTDMEKLWRVPGGSNCAVNQVLYHLGSRGIEFDLLPWMLAHGVTAMAYCPLAQAGTLQRRLLVDPLLADVAQRHGATVMQLLLAFTLRKQHLTAIPKASSTTHVEENARAAALQISDDDWARIDAAFPPPTRKVPLDIE